MLTKTDLSQIKKIVREEIESEVETLATSLRSEIKFARMEIQNDIKNLSSRIKDLEIKMKDLEIKVKDLGILARSTQKCLKRIEKKLDKSINFLDIDYLALKKRVEAIEQHINLSP
ncbi:MAG: hypothetical protein HYS83_00855 [Candidatus Blackburnbacteria bacterium]|nr:hypothetical protein [Candidatus Blackburnbacteria bacterium]